MTGPLVVAACFLAVAVGNLAWLLSRYIRRPVVRPLGEWERVSVEASSDPPRFHVGDHVIMTGLSGGDQPYGRLDVVHEVIAVRPGAALLRSDAPDAALTVGTWVNDARLRQVPADYRRVDGYL